MVRGGGLGQALVAASSCSSAWPPRGPFAAFRAAQLLLAAGSLPSSPLMNTKIKNPSHFVTGIFLLWCAEGDLNPHAEAHAPQTCVSTNSTIRAIFSEGLGFLKLLPAVKLRVKWRGRNPPSSSDDDGS
jgi:hypothetical protein